MLLILYIWKVTQQIGTNIDGAEGHKINIRNHSTQCIKSLCVIEYPTKWNPAQSLQENAVTVFVSLMYNSLIKYPRDMRIVKTKKFKLENRQISRTHSRRLNGSPRQDATAAVIS